MSGSDENQGNAVKAAARLPAAVFRLCCLTGQTDSSEASADGTTLREMEL